MALPEAIRRMTSLPAAQFGIRDRGLIRAGSRSPISWSSIPHTVKDNATYEKPHQYPTGIVHVIVNGVPVLDPNGLTGARPGRPVYGPGRTPSPHHDARLSLARVVAAAAALVLLAGDAWPRAAAQGGNRHRYRAR